MTSYIKKFDEFGDMHLLKNGEELLYFSFDKDNARFITEENLNKAIARRGKTIGGCYVESSDDDNNMALTEQDVKEFKRAVLGNMMDAYEYSYIERGVSKKYISVRPSRFFEEEVPDCTWRKIRVSGMINMNGMVDSYGEYKDYTQVIGGERVDEVLSELKGHKVRVTIEVLD